MKHDDLTRYIAQGEYDTTAPLECYFEDYTGNLWFVYIGDHEVINLLSDTTIQAIEREYHKICRLEQEQNELDMAIDRYHQKIEANLNSY